MGININHSKNTIKTEDKLTIEATNNVSVTNNRIVDVQDPIDDQDAVTKKYLEDAIANLTSITDLLTPQTAPVISAKTLDLVGDGPYRITNFTQTDNTSTGLTATAGSIVPNVLRSNDFSSVPITQVGPGKTGTLNAIRNGTITSTVTFDENDNSGTYTDTDTLVITNNIDYGLITGDALGFSQCYDVVALGTDTVPGGWNNIKLEQDGQETNTVTWYADLSAPGAPIITNISITPGTVQEIEYSSTIPHYTSDQIFDVEFDVGVLSGDFYPATDKFFDASSSTPSLSAFAPLADLTYADVFISTPLPQNYLHDLLHTVNTSVTIKQGTAISPPGSGPSATVDNSYATTTAVFASDQTILRIDGSSVSKITEWNIPVINVGFGTGNATRRVSLDTDTPAQASFSAFNSTNGPLNAWDSTVVGGVVTHDTTDYSTGYLPVGPDLSTGRSGTQYFECAFSRSAVSKFAISWAGKISGCWVKLPGTTIDSTSSLNGWLDATIPYEGSGVPGANTGAGGNGTNGCGLGGIVTTGSTTNESIDITFGTESSSNANNNLIVVRFALNAGDSITALQFNTAS